MSTLLTVAPRPRLAALKPPPTPPPPKCSPCPWDIGLGWRGSRSRETGLGCSSPGSSESSERSHRMIKGKWRIDLGGKIKGAKSVALGSAVTKRGQDNSLQMCERCKYQAGGGAGQGARDGGWAAPRGLGTLGRLPCTAGPSPVGVHGGRETGCRGTPGFQQGFRFWGASLLARRCPPSPIPARWDPGSRVQIPPESLCAPPHQAFPAAPRAASRTGLCSTRLPAPTPPSRLAPFAPPRAGGGGGSLRSGSLWRRCVRRSLCRGAGSRGNANEAKPGEESRGARRRREGGRSAR